MILTKRKFDFAVAMPDLTNFLANHLKPYSEEKKRRFYPVVQKVLGSPDSPKTMTHNHVEVGR